jgi:hypothetical protein
LTLHFEPEAIHAVLSRASREGSTVEALCEKLFRDFPFGLQLVARGSGKKSFVLGSDAVLNPDGYLSDLVVTSYRGAPVGDDATPKPESDSHGA